MVSHEFEGLWVFRLQGLGDNAPFHNAGVIVFNDGKLCGGDHGFFWVGKYQKTGDGAVTAEATVTNHNPDMTQTAWGETVPAGSSFPLRGAFRRDDADHSLMVGDITLVGSPRRFTGYARKVADLP